MKAIILASEKKYSDFSAVVKDKLLDKLSMHPVIANYSKEYDRIQNFKNHYNAISNDSSTTGE